MFMISNIIPNCIPLSYFQSLLLEESQCIGPAWCNRRELCKNLHCTHIFGVLKGRKVKQQRWRITYQSKPIFHGITWFTYRFPCLIDILVIVLTPSNRFICSGKCLFDLPWDVLIKGLFFFNNLVILKEWRRVEVNIKCYIFQW